MSIIIIPLAGPDFYTKEFGIRPLYPVGKSTLLQHILENRPWFPDAVKGKNQLVFVLREEPPHSNTMLDFIKQHYPKAHIVMINGLTKGAPLSVLAGITQLNNFSEPLILDLIDINFNWDIDENNYFLKNKNVDAILPYFTSTDKKFSYLTLNDNFVIQAREKQCISTNASAGVYIFRNAAIYLNALAYGLEKPEICTVQSIFFICPLLNGVIATGKKVCAYPVENVEPISQIFHLNNIGGSL